MILIAMMFVLLMYALLSAFIIYASGKAASWLGYNPAIAKKRIKILWFAPIIIWLVWDLPTIPLHKYYCATQAGFFVYKTPEQWLKEHPEVTQEELRFVGGMDNQGRYRPLYAPIDKSLWDEGKRYRAKVEWVSWFNSRIYQNGRLKKITFFPIRKHIFQFEDVSTGEVLAESIYFSSGYAPAMTTGGITGFKGWLKSSGCGIGIGDAAQYKKQLQILGDKYD